MKIGQKSGTDSRTITTILIAAMFWLAAHTLAEDNDCVQPDGTIKQTCTGEMK